MFIINIIVIMNYLSFKIIIFVGIWIMILGTYANLYAMEESSNTRVLITTAKSLSQIDNLPLNLNKENIHMIPDVSNNLEILPNVKGMLYIYNVTILYI